MVEEAYEDGQSESITRITIPAFQTLDGHLQSLEEGHVARLVYRLFVRNRLLGVFVLLLESLRRWLIQSMIIRNVATSPAPIGSLMFDHFPSTLSRKLLSKFCGRGNDFARPTNFPPGEGRPSPARYGWILAFGRTS